MNRKNFLKSFGLTSLGISLPVSRLIKAEKNEDSEFACTLIPTETAGPFPLDLTANEKYFRQDVREDRTGIQLNLKLKIFGANNCAPLPNARVNIWHCDKDGLYSGYSLNNNPGQAGKTYLRGYQMTDANGEVEFITIFPGWYSGRICHIHFQVYVSSSYSAISQLTFDLTKKNDLYSANKDIYTKGNDPLSYSQDNIFSDGYAYQLASLNPNTETGGYSAYLEVAVQASGTVGIGHIEKENAKQFSLGQNYPNPYQEETTIPLTLLQASRVILEIWDLNGRKVANMLDETLGSGEHLLNFSPSGLKLPAGNYAYQLQVINSDGLFKDCKMMTAR